MEQTDIISSKLTSKYQATIPAAVRESLSLGKGDEIVFDMSGDEVVMRNRASASALRARTFECAYSEMAQDAQREHEASEWA
jgi:antitoxin PrlF